MSQRICPRCCRITSRAYSRAQQTARWQSTQATAGPSRSHIFDLPDPVPGQAGLNIRKQRRLDALLPEWEKRNEEKRSNWHDPYYQMSQSKVRRCFVTRQYMPKDFMVCLRSAAISQPDPKPPSLFLQPDGILHPRYQPRKTGLGLWLACNSEIASRLSGPGPHMGMLFAQAPGATVPASLSAQIHEQLCRRVIQELELLRDRLAGECLRVAQREKLDVGNRVVARRLDTEEARRVGEDGVVSSGGGDGERGNTGEGEGEGEGEGRVVMLLDTAGLGKARRPPPAIEEATSDEDEAERSKDEAERSKDEAEINKDEAESNKDEGESNKDEAQGEKDPSRPQRPSDTTVPESPPADPPFPLVRATPSSPPLIPIYHLSHLLPPTMHADARRILGEITTLERREAHRARIAAQRRRPPTDSGAKTSDGPRRKASNLVAIMTHPLPPSSADNTSGKVERVLEGRCALAVPLCIALWRVRCWYGQGWEDYEVDMRSRRV